MAPKVCLEDLGCMLGTFRPGYETIRYEAFLGVPYAKPPTGALRFKNPQPANPWPGTLSATSPKSDCLQKNYVFGLPVAGDEDCLYLNIYRPAQRAAKKLPVLFYIHPGGFFCGSPSPSMFGPEYFMDTKEVIMVAVAYRLGPFGFLSTGDKYMTGNFGLKDQNLALKWVQKHISSFGGDSSRVTIFGHSAGGASVHFHMLSPASKGLFRNAILISGTATSPFAKIVTDPKAQVIKLAEAAGVPGAPDMTSPQLVKALRTLDPLKLMNASHALKTWNVYPFTIFRPIVEQESWREPFLTTDVLSLLENDPPQTVPWITGVSASKGEGTAIALRLMGDTLLRDQLNEDFDNLLSVILELPAAEAPGTVKNMVDRLVAEYMGGVHELNNDTTDGFLELLGDVNFYYPFYKTIAANVETGKEAQSPKGIIKFNYRGPYSYSLLYSGNPQDFGTAHIDDTLYLFSSPLAFPLGFTKTSPEANLVKRYVRLFVEFAKTGKVEEFERMGTCTKKVLAAQKGAAMCNYLDIGNGMEPFQVGNGFNVGRMQLWNELYKTLP